MASLPRDYMADEPVLVTTRCVLRLKFLKHPAVKTEIRRLIAKWASACGVEVMAFTMAENHLHLLLSQERTGHDRAARRRGIFPFMRNVLSAVARYANAVHSSQGRFWERVYYSRRRPSSEQALQSLAYILEHPVKHGVAGGFDDVNTSGGLYFRGTPDGVSTAAIGLFLARDPEVRWQAIEALLREMYADPRWQEEKTRVEVASDAIERHPEVIDKTGWRKAIAVGLWAGEEAAERARKAVLTAPRRRFKFRSRNAPAPGDVIRVVFEEVPAVMIGGVPAADSS